MMTASTSTSTSTTSALRRVTLELEADVASVICALPHEEIRRLIGGLVGARTGQMSAAGNSVTEHRDTLPLTERETQVLTLIASGYTREEIGGALSISRYTAATHVATIYRKLDIRSIAEATRMAIASGVIRLA